MPFEESTILRSSKAERVAGAVLRSCSAEDLIVHKAFAARPQDWVDVEGVILTQCGRLVWSQTWSDLEGLASLKGEPRLVSKLERIAKSTERLLGPYPTGPVSSDLDRVITGRADRHRLGAKSAPAT